MCSDEREVDWDIYGERIRSWTLSHGALIFHCNGHELRSIVTTCVCVSTVSRNGIFSPFTWIYSEEKTYSLNLSLSRFDSDGVEPPPQTFNAFLATFVEILIAIFSLSLFLDLFSSVPCVRIVLVERLKHVNCTFEFSNWVIERMGSDKYTDKCTGHWSCCICTSQTTSLN